MATVYHETEIDASEYIDEINTDELITELIDRKLNRKQLQELEDGFKIGNIVSNKPESIIDQMKVEVCMEGFKSKTLEEIEQFFKKQ